MQEIMATIVDNFTAVALRLVKTMREDEAAVCRLLVFMAKTETASLSAAGTLIAMVAEAIEELQSDMVTAVDVSRAVTNFLSVFNALQDSALFLDANAYPDRLKTAVDTAVSRVMNPVRIMLDAEKDNVRFALAGAVDAMHVFITKERNALAELVLSDIRRRVGTSSDPSALMDAHKIKHMLTLKFVDSWLEHCLSTFVSVDAVSHMLDAQAMVAGARYLLALSVLAGVNPRLYEVNQLHYPLEMVTGIGGVRERAVMLAQTGTRLDRDNQDDAAVVRDTSRGVETADNLRRTLAKEKEEYRAAMQAQKTLLRAETWVFVCVFVSCLLFVLATSHLATPVNTLVIVVLCLVLVWMLGMEILLLAGNFK